MERREFLTTTTALTASLAGWMHLGMTGTAARAASQSDESSIEDLESPWPLRDSESFVFDSKHVGDRFAVGIAKPPGRQLPPPAPQTSGPLDVVYVLDGSWALGIASALCMLQLVDLVKPGFPQLLLVGVDYPVGAPNSRSRDYTMEDSVPAIMRPALEANPKTAPGGAAKFLKFLEEELDPWVRENYSTTNRPAGILGDSFGGTFTFYAFTRQTRLFDRYWLGSPGIFETATDWVARFTEVLKGDLVHPTQMFLSFGELEAAGGVDFYEDMGRQFDRTTSALHRNPNDQLTWTSKMYPGHTHTTILAPALNDALLHLYGPHQP